MSQKLLKSCYQQLNEIKKLKGISALLGWDQNVYMPKKAAPYRAKQIQYIELAMHNLWSDKKFISDVQSLYSNCDVLPEADAINIREAHHEISRRSKLSAKFIADQAELHSLTYCKWREIKASGDFKLIEKELGQVFEMAREEAAAVSYHSSPYEPLFDNYEPQTDFQQARALLIDLAQKLKDILAKISFSETSLRASVLRYPVIQQEALCIRIAQAVGYSFESGRLDATTHPFQTTIGLDDIRITTRYSESNYYSALFSSLHEVGHALYEQGLPAEYFGTPLGRSISLGVHESQSRFWENIVGRSRPFSVYLHRQLTEFFPEGYQRSTPETIWKDINRVSPSLIRVEADEVTYSLHVVIRMLLEEDLLTEKLKVKDLPEAWNAYYSEYLGITPPNQSQGVLQDVHWFAGTIGYFPTYALGNIYSGIILEALTKDIPNFDSLIENGEFAAILAWLKKNIHNHGRRYSALELMQRISGGEVTAQPFVRYLERKYLG